MPSVRQTGTTIVSTARLSVRAAEGGGEREEDEPLLHSTRSGLAQLSDRADANPLQGETEGSIETGAMVSAMNGQEDEAMAEAAEDPKVLASLREDHEHIPSRYVVQ